MDSLNLNDELFSYNNSNSNNSNHVSAIFGSPDFRNMNFNFGVNDFQKKVPFKVPCSSNNTKRIRNSQSSPPNDIRFNQRVLSNGGSSREGMDANGSQQNEFCDNLATGHHQQVNSVDEGADLDDFGLEANNINRMFSMKDDMPEEMKRNLLVNALRDDKFTSKLFKSLREDVYKEIYSIIQQTETDPQYLFQLFKELQFSTTDPIHSVVMQAMQDLYKRFHSNGTESNDDDNETYGENENENQPQSLSSLLASQQHHEQQYQLRQQQYDGHSRHHQQQESLSSPFLNNHRSNQLSQNKDLNGSTNGDMRDNNHSNEVMNSLTNSERLRWLAYKVLFESATTLAVKGSKKTEAKYEMTSQRSSPKIPNEVYSPNNGVVRFIISDICKIIPMSDIDDDTFVQIAQLTIEILKNTPSFRQYLPTPKELYCCIKSFEIRNREKFLSRYEKYLQSFILEKVTNEDTNTMGFVNKKSSDGMNPSTVPLTEDFGINLSMNTGNIQNNQKVSHHSKSNIPLGAVSSSSSSTNELRLGELNVTKNQTDNDNMNNTESGGVGGVQAVKVTSSHNLTVNAETGDGTSSGGRYQNISAASDEEILFRNAARFVCPHDSMDGNATEETPPSIYNTVVQLNSGINIANQELAEADQICSPSSLSNNVIQKHMLRQRQHQYDNNSSDHFNEQTQHCNRNHHQVTHNSNNNETDLNCRYYPYFRSNYEVMGTSDPLSMDYPSYPSYLKSLLWGGNGIQPNGEECSGSGGEGGIKHDKKMNDLNEDKSGRYNENYFEINGDDDEEEDDRAQFMMTDAACALVFPTLTGNNLANGDRVDLLPSQNSSLICIQNADSSTGDSITSNPVMGVSSAAAETPPTFIADTTVKRNSVP